MLGGVTLILLLPPLASIAGSCSVPFAEDSPIR